MGLFSSIAGIFGAAKKKKAAKKAAAAQIEALQKGIGVVQGQQATSQAALDEAVKRFLPFIETGQQANTGLAELLGLAGAEKQGAALEAIKASPMLKQLLDGGSELILANASATGGLRGGNTQRSLADFGADTYASLVEDQIGRLGALSTQGLTAAGGSGSLALGSAELGSDVANTIASLLSGQGTAKAGGIIAKANASADMFKNIAGAAGDIASAFLPTGGVGGQIRGLI